VDPHHDLYTLTRSLSDLQKIDWAPYTALLAGGQVDMVMSTHVIVAAVDAARPATLSRAVITGILRQQMHFDGVIETDAIYMLQSRYSLDQIILQSAQAGNDIISAAYTPQVAAQAMSVLVNAVHSGAISKQQIDDSVRRILLLKLHYGLLSMAKS
jgi:beta-glucosidase-like glycosyl hydrolase